MPNKDWTWSNWLGPCTWKKKWLCHKNSIFAETWDNENIVLETKWQYCWNWHWKKKRRCNFN